MRGCLIAFMIVTSSGLRAIERKNLAPTERPVVIGEEVYILRLSPLACSPGTACGTPFLPRRYRGEVFKDGKRVGMFDRPCIGDVCVGLEGTVERAVRR